MLDDRSLVKWKTSNLANEQGRAVLEIARELVRLANGGEAPVVLDPLAREEAQRIFREVMAVGLQ